MALEIWTLKNMSENIVTTKKQNGRVVDLRWKKREQIMLLVAQYREDEEEKQKEEMQNFENNSTLEFLTFWLSYCT